MESSSRYNKVADLYTTVAKVFRQNGEPREAMLCFKRAAHVAPSAQAFNNVGVSLSDLGDINGAIQAYDQALELDPKYAPAISNKANIHRLRGEFSIAEQLYIDALNINPEFADAYNNLGSTLKDKGELEKSIRHFKKALKLNPDDASTYFNLALTYNLDNQPQLAIEHYKKAIMLNPKHAKAHGHLYHLLRKLCLWRSIDNLDDRLSKLTSEALSTGEAVEEPFRNMVRVPDDKQNYEVAKFWAQQILSNKSKSDYQTYPHNRERIRIGYMSDGLREFPTGQNIISVLENHNKQKFEIYIFSYGKKDKGKLRSRIESCADKLIYLDGKGYKEAADIVNDNKIDILVDLKGWTKGSRLETFAHRPAPVQISYLGYPGTTGADFMDYIIADRTVIPKNSEKYFSEKVIFMPFCYRPLDVSLRVNNKKTHNKDFTFGSVNSTYKITPEMFAVWTMILKKTENTKLKLYVENEFIEDNLIKYLSKKGVSKSRVSFLTRIDKHTHLKRLGVIDLALDTTPVNGHSTTMDCLWAGVPVLTTKGAHFASRVSESCLIQAGLKNLVAKDLIEYEKLAIKISKDKKAPKVNRRSILFDMRSYTKSLEEAYFIAWKNYLMKKQATNIYIEGK